MTDKLSQAMAILRELVDGEPILSVIAQARAFLSTAQPDSASATPAAQPPHAEEAVRLALRLSRRYVMTTYNLCCTAETDNQEEAKLLKIIDKGINAPSTPVPQPDTAGRAPDNEVDYLGNLLAIIHRDGGHYQYEHGTEKATSAAIKEIYRLRAPTLTAAPDTGADERYPPGYVLAMRVLQSDLYETLDDIERADCDELIARHCISRGK